MSPCSALTCTRGPSICLLLLPELGMTSCPSDAGMFSEEIGCPSWHIHFFFRWGLLEAVPTQCCAQCPSPSNMQVSQYSHCHEGLLALLECSLGILKGAVVTQRCRIPTEASQQSPRSVKLRCQSILYLREGTACQVYPLLSVHQ